MGGKLFITILLAICLHLSVALAFFYKEQKNDGSIDKGKDGIVVGVGITGSFSDTEKTGEKEVEIVEQKKTIKKPKVELKPKPKPKVKPKPKPKAKVESKPKVKPKPKPKAKVESKPKPKPIVESKMIKESNTKIESNSKTSTDAKVSKKAQLARNGTGIGDQVNTGGDPAAKQGYLSIVKTRISRVKKYPRSARKDGVVGTATVRFIIKLNGKVKNIQLIKSSGDKRLDKEAKKMLKKASPFPPIPKDVSKEPLDLTLPIEFKLKTIKNKFY